jgi:SAM-dependent methyltransferase
MASDLADLIDGTPGRFVPGEMSGQLVEAEHLNRYWWAAGLARGRRVLDAGCGIGYGAGILARAGASEVVGVDIAPEAVEAARAGAADGTRFETGDVRDLPFDDDSFDAVVCFEVIEHVEEQARTLDELRRVLVDGGVLAISSPNPTVYVEGNPHHKRELSPSELEAMLGERWNGVRLLQQSNFVASFIRGVDGDAAPPDAPREGTLLHRLAATPLDGPTYTLALASDGPPPEPAALVTLAAPLEIRDWVERFRAQEGHMQRQADALETARRQAEAHRDLARRLADAESELAELPTLRAHAAALAGTHVELAAELERANADLERARDAIRDLQASASWRLTAPLRSAKQIAASKRGQGR